MITCLTPIRNGMNFLPHFVAYHKDIFSRFIVLDDYCNDDSIKYLKNHLNSLHVTKRQSSKPEIWDDLENRQELLQYFESKYTEGWVLFLDCDELIDRDDSLLLLNTIKNGDLDKKKAYGFPLFRMIDDLNHFTKGPLIVYRLFYYTPGEKLSGPRLHFEPIPKNISVKNWKKLPIRIKHLASMTTELRRKRYKKYQIQDPKKLYQKDYSNLLEVPITINNWAKSKEYV